MGRILLLPLLVCAIVNTHAIAETTSSPAVIYSPWMKFCLKEGRGTTCFVGRDARTVCGVTVASVVFIERENEATATLRMTLPTAVNRDQEARIVVDQDQPISRPFNECHSKGCTAEYRTLSSDLVARLKSGRVLAVHGVDASGQLLNGRFPLAGFAEAYDGPGTEPRVFEAPQNKLREELEARRKAAGETRKPEGC